MKLLTFFALTFMASWSLWFAAARLSGADAGFVSLSAGLRALAGVWPPFGNTPWYLLIIATAFSTPVQAGEENWLARARASAIVCRVWPSGREYPPGRNLGMLAFTVILPAHRRQYGGSRFRCMWWR